VHIAFTAGTAFRFWGWNGVVVALVVLATAVAVLVAIARRSLDFV
jgi:hypothetical protein